MKKLTLFFVFLLVSLGFPATAKDTTSESSKNPSILSLSKQNTLSLRGPVTSRSVSQLQHKAMKMSNRLPEDATIYLVVNSPGGSIGAGNNLIDFLQGLPQEINTISIFSASMAFNLVQSMNERILLPSGILMSHKARISGLRGEIPGEANVRLEFYTNITEQVNKRSAKRMDMSLKGYRRLIRNEYWTRGKLAVEDNAADSTTLAKCGSEFGGTVKEKVYTIFGPIQLTMSECPLITTPLSMDMSSLKFDNALEKKKVFKFAHQMFYNPEKFVRNYIKNNKYKDFLK